MLQSFKIHTSLIILTVFSAYCALAVETDQLSFNHYTTDDGLSQNTIYCSIQDSRGFMWFGTQDGLNRFDGYNFKVYRHDPNDSTTISANWIWSIYEDSESNLWIGTYGGGLCCYDRNSETFTRYKNDPENKNSISHNTIWDIIEDPFSTIWVATDNGLNRLVMKKDSLDSNSILSAKFEYYPPLLEKNSIFKILQADSNYLWITSAHGLLRFDIPAGQYTFYKIDPGYSDLGRLKGCAGKSGYFWLSSPKYGLYRFNPQTGNVKHYKHNPEDKNNNIVSDFVISVIEDDEGVVWVGTTSWLTLIYPSGHYRHYEYNPADRASLNHDYISSIYQDKNGIVWLCTRNGLNVYSRTGQKFNHVKYNPLKSNTLSSPNVICFLEDSFSNIWIGTNDGLNRYNPQSGLFKHFKEDEKNPQYGPAVNYILSFLEDSQKHIWIGLRNFGISRWNPKTKKFRHYRFDPDNINSLASGIILCILEDSNKDVWVGTNRGGLHLYNPREDSFIRFPNDKKNQHSLNDVSVFTMYETRDGKFWIGTSAGGINIMDRKSRTFKYLTNDPDDPYSLSNNMVVCFHETRKGELWIGTAAGLNKLVKTTSDNGEISYSFQPYLLKNGLPNEVIYGILEDDDGDLWVSTNKGVAEIDVSDNGFKVQTYKTDDGLQGNEFNQNAYMRDSGGYMYFGGSNGYNVFHPDRVRLNAHKPSLAITSFKILNHEVDISNDGTSVLQKSITETKSIELSWKDNVFSFEFAALDFTMPDKNQYAYKMQGFDQDWIYSGTRHFVTYTNLDPGEYIFRVKGANNDGIWSEQETVLEILITPPPWKTWWAYLAYFIIIASTLIGFIRYRIHAKTKKLIARAEEKSKIQRAKREEREHMRKKISADFHDEAGNLITKIGLFSELAKRNTASVENHINYLDKVQENTKKLSAGMRDFIWVLDPDKDTLYDALIRLKDLGNSLFEYSDIRFHSKGLEQSFCKFNLDLDDRRQLILIFKEAMNNCLKHSKAKNTSLLMRLEQDEFNLILKDDGIGFEPDTENQGYGIKNMRSRAQKIGATLEFVSKTDNGMLVRLKKNMSGWKIKNTPNE